MSIKDYGSYTLVSETPDALELTLTKGQKILYIFSFRVIPIVLLGFILTIPENFERDLGWLYWILIFGLYASIVSMLFYRYISAITFSKDGIVFNFNRCYFNYNETERLNSSDEILVAEERPGRGGTFWVFYLIRQGQKKKKLFIVPTALPFHDEIARDNFITIFGQRHNLKTTVKKEK